MFPVIESLCSAWQSLHLDVYSYVPLRIRCKPELAIRDETKREGMSSGTVALFLHCLRSLLLVVLKEEFSSNLLRYCCCPSAVATHFRS